MVVGCHGDCMVDMTGKLYRAASLEWAATVLVWNSLLSLFSSLWLICCATQRVVHVLVMLAYALQLSLHGVGIAAKAFFVSVVARMVHKTAKAE